MMIYERSFLVCCFAALLLLYSCEEGGDANTPIEPTIYYIPVVVHVIHKGEPLGEGYNLSDERIMRQIEILNEDFRRKEGTPGYNDHPDGADARIEFVLARSTPDGDPTSGIVRIDTNLIKNPISYGERFNHFAHYSYWDYRHYLNIWIEPLPEDFINVALGMATGPDTDLLGHELLLDGEPTQAEGIIINSFHFGESGIASDYNLGRTLTHEAGHYLGLLHLWGSGDCDTNDYCEDTPPISHHQSGCPAGAMACDGGNSMIGNYMDYTADACMSIFTDDQVARMHYVLEKSEARKSLLTSPGLELP